MHYMHYWPQLPPSYLILSKKKSLVLHISSVMKNIMWNECWRFKFIDRIVAIFSVMLILCHFSANEKKIGGLSKDGKAFPVFGMITFWYCLFISPLFEKDKNGILLQDRKAPKKARAGKVQVKPSINTTSDKVRRSLAEKCISIFRKIKTFKDVSQMPSRSTWTRQVLQRWLKLHNPSESSTVACIKRSPRLQTRQWGRN